MNAQGKDGQNVTIVGNTNVDGKAYLIAELKFPKYIDGVLTKYVLALHQNLYGLPSQQTVEEPEQEIKHEPTESDSPIGEVPA